MIQPLHERIGAGIRTRILSGALAPGDRLPTEHALMADHGCSRMTVNKALSALAAAGLIERRRGAGSFVAQPRLHSMVLDVPDLAQEVIARGHGYAFRLIERRVARRPGAGDGALAVGPGPTLYVVGLHLADERPLAIEHRRISLTSVPAIEDAPFDREPPGTWLLRHIPWTDAETRIAATGADARAAALLAIAPGAPLLEIERRTWRGTDPVTAVRQSFRADAYHLAARFNAGDAAARRATS